MKSETEQTYNSLLTTYDGNKEFKKISNYFEKRSILNVFLKSFLKTYSQNYDYKNDKQLQSMVRFSLINQHILKTNLSTVDLITRLKIDYPFLNAEFKNYQAEIIANFKLTEKEISDYFSYHQAYCLIALVYAEPFKNQKNYEEFLKFFYYVIMYINLEFSFNRFNVLEDYTPFIVKLHLQLEMIKSLANLDPINYNKLIRKLNKWFAHRNLTKVTQKEQRGEK